MSKPATYHRNKIEHYYRKLLIRKAVLQSQLKQDEFKTLEPHIQGEIKAIDMVLGELREEFSIDE